MYIVNADVLRNRLIVTLYGSLLLPEMKECTDKTIEASQSLKPGYDLITDISQLQEIAPKAIEEIKRGQRFLRQSGIKHAMRVRGAAVLTSIQIAMAGKAVDYQPATVATMADAESYLEAQAQMAGVK